MSDPETTSDASQALRCCLRPEIFRALSAPTRLQVVMRLACAERPQTVTEVAGCCGVHLSGVSRHLATLRDAGLVEARREGREVRYALDRDALTGALRGLAEAIDGCAEACAEHETAGCVEREDETR